MVINLLNWAQLSDLKRKKLLVANLSSFERSPRSIASVVRLGDKISKIYDADLQLLVKVLGRSMNNMDADGDQQVY